MVIKHNVHHLDVTPELIYNEALRQVPADAERSLATANALIDKRYLHGYTLAGLAAERLGRNADAYDYYVKSTESVGALEAWLGRARLRYLGKGVDQDFEEALACYRAVFDDTEHPIAAIRLGVMYRDGLGTKKDLLIARSFLNEPMQNGYVWAIRAMAGIDRAEHKFFSCLWKMLRASGLGFVYSFAGDKVKARRF